MYHKFDVTRNLIFTYCQIQEFRRTKKKGLIQAGLASALTVTNKASISERTHGLGRY
jgi:hypothetical protein